MIRQVRWLPADGLGDGVWWVRADGRWFEWCQGFTPPAHPPAPTLSPLPPLLLCAGPFRAQFLQEAVADLRAALRAVGSELVVRLGRPEEVLGELVRRTGAGAVFCHTEVRGWAAGCMGMLCGAAVAAAASRLCCLSHATPFVRSDQSALPYSSPAADWAGPHTLSHTNEQVTYEEQRVEAAVKAAAEAGGAHLRSFWANTLAHLEDLPFPLAQLPQSFGALGGTSEWNEMECRRHA